MSEEKKPAKKVGKYAPELVKKILDCLREGNTRTTAAHIANIGVSTFYDWLVEKPEFKKAVEQVEADSVSELVSKIKKAGDKDWRALSFLLERRSPEWNKQDKVDVTSNQKEIVFTIDLGRSNLTEDTNEPAS